MECTTPEPGFNRTIKLLDIGDVERKISIAANDRERAFLAHKYDLVRIDKLSASVLLQRRSNGGGKIDVNGKLFADVVQKCVVSLLPVEKHVAENFSLVFEKGVVSGPGLDSFSLADADPPEFYSGDFLEIGGLVGEYLSLGLDPYPRHPDAALPIHRPSNKKSDEAETDNRHKPLKNLRRLLQNKNK